MDKHFYKFRSSTDNDTVNTITIFAGSLMKAYAMAFRYFAKNNCIGVPEQIAI